MSEEYISIKPSEAIHGGGMVPEGRYKLGEVKYAMWDYNGTRPESVPALGVEYINADGQSFAQYYSAGDAKNLRPNPDGQRLIKTGSTGALNDSTNLYQFMKAAVNAGISEDEMGSPIAQIFAPGTEVEVIHEAVQEREIKGQKRAKTTMPVIGKIISRPNDKAGAAKAGAKTASKANGADNSALNSKATSALVDVLKEAPNRQLEKKAITTAVFKKIPAADADRSAVLNLCIKDEFLSDLIGSGVLYDAATGVVAYVGE